MDHDDSMQHSPDHGDHASHNPESFRRKFWLCLVLTIPALLFSRTVQGWLGLNFSFLGSELIPAIFGVIIFFYGGLVFLRGARAELRAKTPGMMTLIAMAITVALVYSLAVTFRIVQGMDFWWELATLITVMLLGHWFEMASVVKAQGALKELAKLLPDEAEVVIDNETKKIPVAALKLGNLVLVRPGARLPADGEVVKGESAVDESMLTGESKPVKKATKSTVIAGTINSTGALTVRVTKIGEDTALAGIMRLIAEAQNSKSKTQILADRAAYYLTFIAIGAALTTGISWVIAGQLAGFVLERVVTVLVIACPHALGLAIPLVTAISTTYAAKNGLLVRQRMALETARNIDVVLFDKTGTLTEGKQGVVGVVSLGDERELLSLAAAIESESEHPIARAVVSSAKAQDLRILHSSSFKSLPGKGAKADLNGKTFYVGNQQLLKELGINETPQTIVKAAVDSAREGKTVVYVADSKSVLGAIMLADVIRRESKEAVEALRAQGKRVAMVTGDSRDVAAWVARELDIKEVFAEVLPGRKAEIVEKLQKDGSRVAMVGDGVNDAPALVQADVGIAIGAGTDVAIESAGIVLAGSDPTSVAKVFRLSSATYAKMRQNLAWAAGYNVVAIPLAAGAGAAFGLSISPAIGALLMSLSTIIVAVNAQFLRRLELK